MILISIVRRMWRMMMMMMMVFMKMVIMVMTMINEHLLACG